MEPDTVLVTGSSGYIGHNLIQYLQEHTKLTVVGLDMVASEFTTIVCDMTDKTSLVDNLKRTCPKYIIHLAAMILVGESETNPDKYWQHNVTSTMNLLSVITTLPVTPKLVFMSSAAVYGNGDGVPESVYGHTKLTCERMIHHYSEAYNIVSVILRLFNVGGGNRRIPNTNHLIPIALSCLHDGRTFHVFGKDYDTLDGTCIRDYVHVDDVCSIIVKSLNLKSVERCTTMDIGTGRGNSVLEVISTIEQVTKKKLKILYDRRRPGDPNILISCHISRYIDRPFDRLEDIIRDEYNIFNEKV